MLKTGVKDPVIDVLLEAAEELGYEVGDINGDLEDEGFYLKESNVFKSLYGAPENKAAIENVIKSIKNHKSFP